MAVAVSVDDFRVCVWKKKEQRINHQYEGNLILKAAPAKKTLQRKSSKQRCAEAAVPFGPAKMSLKTNTFSDSFFPQIKL